MVTLLQLIHSLMERREPSIRKTIYAAIHQSGLYGTVARQKPLLNQRLRQPLWSLQKGSWRPGETKSWSDEANIELLSVKLHHPYSETWLCQYHVIEIFCSSRY